MNSFLSALLLLGWMLWLSGCAYLSLQGEPPEVLVTNVTPLDSTIFEQRLRVDLRIRNPNDFDMSITGLDFRIDLNGQRLARGLGNQSVTVPRLGDAVLTVETSTSTLDVVRYLLSLRKRQDVSYHISGVVHLAQGRMPFENEGVLIEQSQFNASPSNP